MSICIIGGSSSLGQELIKQAELHGESIVATYSKTLFSTTAELVQLDLTNTGQIASFKPKNISHLVFLQGSLFGQALGNYKGKMIEETISINLTASVQIVNNLIAHKCFHRPALITFVASIAAVKGSYDVAYAASKSALIGCVKSIAKYNAPDIRANVICPGLIKDSGMYNAMSADDHSRHLDQTPTNKLTDIKHLAELILLFDQPYFNNLNGAVINLDGGRYI